MTRIIIILATVVLSATTLSAQIAPGMKYKDLKDLYNPQEYVKSEIDPYSKGWSGLASFVVPGLGQLICGETGRGLAIFAGDVALSTAAKIFADKYRATIVRDANGTPLKDYEGTFVYNDEKAATIWGGALLGVGAAGIAYWIWNIVDARNVARVKNMYYQDLQMSPVEFKVYPSVSYINTTDGFKPVTGMTLSLQF